jgi:hypothetical protein
VTGQTTTRLPCSYWYLCARVGNGSEQFPNESGGGCLAEVRDECDGPGHLRDVVKLSPKDRYSSLRLLEPERVESRPRPDRTGST